MDTSLSLSEARDRLEEIVARAASGETVRIVDPKLGAVRLVAEPAQQRPKRVGGQWKGMIQIPSRLMEPLTDDELRWLSGEDSR